MASRPIRLLLIGAHPADTFDQAGGTLAHHIENGDSVTVVAATLGTRSHDWELIDEQKKSGEAMDVEKHQEQARAKKMDETKRACAIMGITDVRSLDFHDDEELVTEPMIQSIADVIRETRPDVLITHHPYEEGGFKLHATIGRATMYAFRKAAGSGRSRSLPAHNTPAVFFMNPTAYVGISMSNSFAAQIDVYVDITDVIDKKVKAMDCIASQYYGGSFARKRAEAADGHYGYDANVPYAEAFQRFRPQLCHRLPVTDFELLSATDTAEEGMERRSTIIPALMPLPDDYQHSNYRVDKKLYD